MDPASGRTLEVGRTLGHYRLLEKIGAGGMGEVWRSRDERLVRDVALKVLLPGTLADDAARKRFRREALALSKLNHPHIATVHDFDSEGGHDFLVMEYVGGVSPGAHRSEGPLAEMEVVRLGLQLAEGLAAAHGEGIVHRDLKPANVRLTADGRLKILDFGLAQLARPSGDDAGSADPWLGIPVTWEQIDGARVIVETGFRDFRVSPSQGSHFFQNLSSFQVGYFTINPDAGEGFVRWDWLAQQPATSERGCVRHLRFERPVVVRMNGRRSEGVILKPGTGEEAGEA